MLVVAALIVRTAGAEAGTLRPPAWDGALCDAAITRVERTARLPPALLHAVGVVETGRVEPRTARVTPWPWSIDVGGQDLVFANKPAAIAAVAALQAAGTRSIDVGCMQINLMYHGHAFASLDEAFDPQANVVYAARFLGRLYAQTGDWRAAAGAYHSQTPELGAPYAQRVMALWPLAGRYVSPASPLAPDPLSRFAPGATPQMRARLAVAAADRARLVAQGVAPPAARPARRPALRPTLRPALRPTLRLAAAAAAAARRGR